MTKLPSTQTSHGTALNTIEEDMLDPNNISVTIRHGKRTVEGYNQNGDKVVIETTYMSKQSDQDDAYRSQTMTVCNQLSKEDRRAVARTLRNENKLSQIEIAKRLGVSQKTISNDLDGN